MDEDWVPEDDKDYSSDGDDVLSLSSSDEEVGSSTRIAETAPNQQQMSAPHLVSVTQIAIPTTATYTDSVSKEVAGPEVPRTISNNLQQIKMINTNTTAVKQEKTESMAAVSAIETQQMQIAKSSAVLELSGSGLNARLPFDPVKYELDATFRLTKYADLHGKDKVPQEFLMKLMKGMNENINQEEQPVSGMGLSITPLRHPGLNLIQTTDLFYPMVEDPYMQGKIACTGVLSDLYAMGITDCDTMLMLVAVSARLTDKERDVVIPLIMQGFKDAAKEVGASLTGGQTVTNPWVAIGGVATAICQPPEFIQPGCAVPGDVLVLTKPLGTEVAVNAHQWLNVPERWNRIKLVVNEDDVRKAYNRAVDCMARMNKMAARLMHKYNAHGATSVNSFGLLGHALDFARKQREEVSFVIHNLPVIAKMAGVAKACGSMFRILQGFSAETSGGLLVCLPREQAAAFCKDIEKQEGYQSWIIGIVEKGHRTARVIDKPRVIEVPAKDKEDSLW